MGDQLARSLKTTLGSKFQSEVGDAVKSQLLDETGKKIFGYATIFISLVDTYSKAVKEANLENVKQWLEVCPHIGGCQGQIQASKLVNENGFTAWRANDGYWYFHPQKNYRVKHAAQIYRESPDSRSWGIEWPGKSKLKLQNCLACCEAYGSDPDYIGQ